MDDSLAFTSRDLAQAALQESHALDGARARVIFQGRPYTGALSAADTLDLLLDAPRSIDGNTHLTLVSGDYHEQYNPSLDGPVRVGSSTAAL